MILGNGWPDPVYPWRGATPAPPEAGAAKELKRWTGASNRTSAARSGSARAAARARKSRASLPGSGFSLQQTAAAKLAAMLCDSWSGRRWGLPRHEYAHDGDPRRDLRKRDLTSSLWRRSPRLQPGERLYRVALPPGIRVPEKIALRMDHFSGGRPGRLGEMQHGLGQRRGAGRGLREGGRRGGQGQEKKKAPHWRSSGSVRHRNHAAWRQHGTQTPAG